VLAVPAKFTTSEQNYTARLGDAVAMDCLSEGDRPLSIAWSFNHASIDWQYNTRSVWRCHLFRSALLNRAALQRHSLVIPNVDILQLASYLIYAWALPAHPYNA